MLPRGSLMVGTEGNGSNGFNVPGHLDHPLQLRNFFPSADGENQSFGGINIQSCENCHRQLVPSGLDGVEVVPDTIQHLPRPSGSFQAHASSMLPSVRDFAVQCANCFQWRLIPTKEKYEEIREHLLQKPFVCGTAREWMREVTCVNPSDIWPDGSRLWAIDRPNIARPPPGWHRILRIRRRGSTKFADVYYITPIGETLRSMVEIRRYLQEHPDMAVGVNMSRFSFQIPRPLQEDYVRKRPARAAAPHDNAVRRRQRMRIVNAVDPLAWAGPADTELQLGSPWLSALRIAAPPAPGPRTRGASRRKRRTPRRLI